MKHLVLFVVFTYNLCAQNKTYWDTTRYQKFKSNLIVGVFQTHRNYNNEFGQNIIPDPSGISKTNYRAESREISGFEVNYDKFSFAIAINSKTQKSSAGKGHTKTLSGNLNFGGNIWFMENSLRYFKGFYDANTPSYDTTFKETGNYYYQPNFTNTMMRSKFMYFTNHKRYAFRSAYTCNYRQLKSGATWIFGASTTYNYMHNDSSFFPSAARPFYGHYASMNGLKVFGISATAGGAASLVLWRAFFINFMFIVGPEIQWRTYDYLGEASRDITYLGFSGDVRGSIGLNFKRCYYMFYGKNEFNNYSSDAVKIGNRSLSRGIIFGWRFNSKTPAFYKKFQSTKIYSAF